MSQLLLKGVYYDDDSGGLWFLNNSGSYEEISVGGTTIYTGDGSLEGNRIVDAAGYDLEITLGGGEFEVSNAGNSNLYIRGATGSDAELRGVNPAGDKDVARVFFSAQGGMADAYFDANYQDGTKLASIHAHAESGLTAFTYSADTHTFNVGMTITELAGVGTRAIAVDANGKIVLL